MNNHNTDRNYEVFETEGGHPIKAWTRGVLFEDKAKQQVMNIAKMPFIHKHVAVMPDVHAGIGATVGSVIATKGAIIPAAVGVDIGCFTADTHIKLVDGTSKTIAALVDAGEFWVWSLGEKKRIVPARATARLTRTNAPLVVVTLDNGESIRCTPDHQFMMRDGTWKEAAAISDNESLMPLYDSRDKDGYLFLHHPNGPGRKMQAAHRIVAETIIGKPSRRRDGQKWCVHHKNLNIDDNRPENLEWIGDGDHARLHRDIPERNTHWQSEEFEKRRIASLRNKAATDDGHAYYAERGTKNIIRYMQERPEHFKASVADNGKRGAKYLAARNKTEAARKKSSEVARRIYTCPYCGAQGAGGFFWKNHIYKHPESGRAAPQNHRVVSVVTLSKREDVYCLTVPEYGNFALAAGVFVHNCGMIAARTTLTASDLPDSLAAIRSSIESAIPHGRSDNGGANDRGAWGDVPYGVADRWLSIVTAYDKITTKHPRAKHRRPEHQLGSLGTGNHFIEMCLDESERVWVMLHSGSRGPGNSIGSYFIERAKNEMRRWFINLPDADLAYLPEGSELFDDYIEAVEWAQDYAQQNRKEMLSRALNAMRATSNLPTFAIDDAFVHCHHNYISREHHLGADVIVTRKGAVRAREGEYGIIPGSMGTRSYIVRGRGNPESFHSCSHGAGRVMSRTEAKKRITLEDHAKATEGVECRKDADVIDESPAAYKSIDAVIEAEKDLVEVVHTLRAVLCVKG